MLVGDLGTVALRDGLFSVLAWGAPDGNVWKGWLTFFAQDGAVFRTGPETSQPDVDALVYWAGGLRPVYLEGALRRAVEIPPAEAGEPPAPIAVEETTPPVEVVEEAITAHGGPQDTPGEDDEAGIVEVIAVDPAFGQCTVRAGDRVIILGPQPSIALGVNVGDRFWRRRPRAA